MNIKLNFLHFAGENPANVYASLENRVAPRKEYDSVAAEEINQLDGHSEALYAVVARELERYVNDDTLCSIDGMFPERKRLTGNYYMVSEYYSRDAAADTYKIAIQAALTEAFVGGVVTSPVEMDYLGLEVWLGFDPVSGMVEVHGVDSSSI
jgi:hypothetical protein